MFPRIPVAEKEHSRHRPRIRSCKRFRSQRALTVRSKCEAFSLDKTGPPAFAGSDDEMEDDGARE